MMKSADRKMGPATKTDKEKVDFCPKKIGEKACEKLVKIILLRTFHLGRSEAANFRVPQSLKTRLAGKLLRVHRR